MPSDSCKFGVVISLCGCVITIREFVLQKTIQTCSYRAATRDITSVITSVGQKNMGFHWKTSVFRFVKTSLNAIMLAGGMKESNTKDF